MPYSIYSIYKLHICIQWHSNQTTLNWIVLQKKKSVRPSVLQTDTHTRSKCTNIFPIRIYFRYTRARAFHYWKLNLPNRTMEINLFVLRASLVFFKGFVYVFSYMCMITTRTTICAHQCSFNGNILLRDDPKTIFLLNFNENSGVVKCFKLKRKIGILFGALNRIL